MISIIIPAYNEESCLSDSIHSIQSYMRMKNLQSEIILVIEPSEDKTYDIACSLASRYKNIKILLNERRMGKGYSVRRGLLAAAGSYCFFSDADLSTPIEELDSMVKTLDTNDIVIGSRYIHGSQIRRKQSLYRQVSGFIFRLFVTYFLRLPFKDTQCGFKGFRKECIFTLFSDLSVLGFSFDVEVLIKAKKHGFNVAEVPVSWQDSDHSSVSFVRDFSLILKEFTILSDLARNLSLGRS